ncbi:hypothetical protein BU251_02655 [Candidatus Velamenicoccus archaeovorus]|uniref:Uncharacterized protein n=1 Tax=Velamenicoccus archaeovorus TaxID=1930593 RepID=A0A410P3Q3_VELA1|nr:hypothetical protein [Candidatus Velamenicoccus archaeovorus]QAT16708.1 hypothetical protein BU251_02655 [Candidatus Velamenicoccus archaeovorus]
MKVSEFPESLRKIILSSVDEMNLEQEVTMAQVSISFHVGQEIHVEDWEYKAGGREGGVRC